MRTGGAAAKKCGAVWILPCSAAPSGLTRVSAKIREAAVTYHSEAFARLPLKIVAEEVATARPGPSHQKSVQDARHAGTPGRDWSHLACRICSPGENQRSFC